MGLTNPYYYIHQKAHTIIFTLKKTIPTQSTRNAEIKEKTAFHFAKGNDLYKREQQGDPELPYGL